MRFVLAAILAALVLAGISAAQPVQNQIPPAASFWTYAVGEQAKNNPAWAGIWGDADAEAIYNPTVWGWGAYKVYSDTFTAMNAHTENLPMDPWAQVAGQTTAEAGLNTEAFNPNDVNQKWTSFAGAEADIGALNNPSKAVAWHKAWAAGSMEADAYVEPTLSWSASQGVVYAESDWVNP